ncbi:MAG: hypothetical protein LBG82_03460 [Clostridiales Family XIII bacterium]|jgi:hypothetical protein|nr:hypothetical protein [Clostridiales Family XIII bacterium]
MARVFREKKSGGALKPVLFAAAAIACVALILNAVSQLGMEQQGESMEIAKEAIVRATVQCYSLEGRYPPSLGYLEDNYGLTLDRGKYVYHYEPFGENIMPRIGLFPLHWE